MALIAPPIHPIHHSDHSDRADRTNRLTFQFTSRDATMDGMNSRHGMFFQICLLGAIFAAASVAAAQTSAETQPAPIVDEPSDPEAGRDHWAFCPLSRPSSPPGTNGGPFATIGLFVAQ